MNGSSRNAQYCVPSGKDADGACAWHPAMLRKSIAHALFVGLVIIRAYWSLNTLRPSSFVIEPWAAYMSSRPSGLERLCRQKWSPRMGAPSAAD